MTQRAVGVDRELQDAIADGLADVKGLLVGRNTDAVGVVEVVSYFHPFLAAGRKIKNFPHDKGWYRRVGVRAKDRGISTAVSSHHNIIYSAFKLLAVVVSVPSSQLLAGHVEFEDCAGIVSAREQERLLFGERQSVMAAALGVIQDGRRFAIPLRQRV